MRRIVMTGMIIGFFVPIFWGVVSLIMFAAPESPAADRYWDIVHITSPSWPIGSSTSSATTVAAPFLNAILYGAVAFVGGLLIQLFRRGGGS